MGEEKTHIIYKAEDIQKYFSGKLSAAEMHVMEKAALDDPLLAEAMEGYHVMNGTDLDNELAKLRAFFTKDQSAKDYNLNPVKRFTMWKAAAAVLVLCSGVALTFLLTKNPASDNALAKAVRQDTMTSANAETLPNSSGTNPTIPHPNKTTNKKGKQAAVSPSLNPPIDTAFVYRPAPTENKNFKDIAGGGYVAGEQKNREEKSSPNNADPYTLNSREGTEPVNSKPFDKAKEFEVAVENNATSLYEFSAQVIGPGNTPLPFANISINNDRKGTYADVNGNIKFTSTDTLVKIGIKSAGYLARNYTLTNNDKATIIMLEKDPVTSKGKAVASRKARSAIAGRYPVLQVDSLADATPVDGWHNYDTYIKNNFKLPTDTDSEKIRGEVEVSFDVSDRGTISNAKADKSLCAWCDEEVLRLLKEGPGWKIKKGLKASGRLKVTF